MTTFNPRIFFLFMFIILSCAFAWPINKIGLLYMSPLWYTTSRLIVGTFSMLGIVMCLGKFSFPSLRDFPLIAIIGLLQISLYLLLANIGLAYLPAGRSSLLAYTTPLWIMPITAFFLKERTGLFQWAGFILSMGGLIILIGPWQLNWSDTHVLFGAVMLLLASLGWAVSMLCVRYMHWRKSPLELIPWQLLLGTVPLLILSLLKEPDPVITWNWPLIASLIYTGVIVTGISYWLSVIVNKELSPVIASLGFLVVPVLSLVISSLFMDEMITLPALSAMGSILVGLVFVTL